MKTVTYLITAKLTASSNPWAPTLLGPKMRSLRSLLPLLLLPFFATSSPLLYARVVSIQDAQALGADNDALPFILEADLPLSTMRKLLISNPLNGPSFDKQDIEDMNRFRIQSPETIAIQRPGDRVARQEFHVRD